jgi:tripartite ATP-independent transporter DctM subunit
MDFLLHNLHLLMFLAAVIFLMMGYPVAFSLAGTALLFALIGDLFGVLSIGLGAIPQRIFGTMVNDTLIAVPLFVIMGITLERSKVAEELLETMGRCFGRLPGGLGLSVTFVGMLLAASTGIVGATVVTMGLLSLPTMLKYKYSPSLACGAIAASGTLGQVIPPSIVLVLLGDQLSNAYQKAQLEMGNFSPDAVSVGDLFAGALIPGLALVAMYMTYQIAVAIFKPHMSPPMPKDESNPVTIGEIFSALLPPIFLIFAVLGSILGGIATPTEAAAVGAVGAFFLGGIKLAPEQKLTILLGALALVLLLILSIQFDLRISRDVINGFEQSMIYICYALCAVVAYAIFVSARTLFRESILQPILESTTHVTCMVFVILIGATFFSLVFRGLGGEEFIHETLHGLPGGTLGAVFAVMLLMFFLGFFLDFLEIVFVVVPLVAPVLLKLPMPDGTDMSPVWLGVLMAVNLQTSFLTPPFGFALFYLRGVAPASIKTSQIYYGIIPFVLIQILALIILWFWPAMATWLPHIIYG